MQISKLEQILAPEFIKGLVGRDVSLRFTDGTMFRGPLLALYQKTDHRSRLFIELEYTVFRGGLDIGGAWRPCSAILFYVMKEKVESVGCDARENIFISAGSLYITIHNPGETVRLQRVSRDGFMGMDIKGRDLVVTDVRGTFKWRGPIVEVCRDMLLSERVVVRCAWLAKHDKLCGWMLRDKESVDFSLFVGFSGQLQVCPDGQRVFPYGDGFVGGCDASVTLGPDGRLAFPYRDVDSWCFIYEPGENLQRNGDLIVLPKKLRPPM